MVNMKFAVEKGPHIQNKRSTFSMMVELGICLLGLFLFEIISYYVSFGGEWGNHALIIFVISVGVSVGSDALYLIPSCLCDKKEKDIKIRFKNWGDKILHSYGWISGLIFTLLLPIGVDYYACAVSAFIGTFFGKCIFGGFGRNIFNPAVAGRVFCQLCFSSSMKTYIGTAPAAGDFNAGASIMFSTQQAGWLNGTYDIPLDRLFLGQIHAGSMGESCIIGLIICCVYLAVRRIIDWRTPVFYIVTFYLTCLFMGFTGGLGADSFAFALKNIMIGGVLFGCVFCLTDPVTSPASRYGRIMVTVICAFIACLIRYQAAAPEGVGSSIIITNMLSPLISKLIKGKSNQHIARKSIIISSIMVASIIFGLVYGTFHKANASVSLIEAIAQIPNYSVFIGGAF